MRFLIIGCGSIGQRHARNLRTLGHERIIGYDPSLELLGKHGADGLLQPVTSLDDAFKQKPDVVFITNPTSLHLETASRAIGHDCDVFVEKPLAHTLDGLSELVKATAERGVVSMVGCNMRFHPGPQKVKALLNERAIGKVTSARIQSGSYLPGWRPWQDYKQSYSAQESLGGGVILDGIHEIDLARWYLDEVTEVFCMAGSSSSLDIEVEDTAELLLRFSSGAIGEVHLDYTQRTYQRSCQIIGDKGTIFWDYTQGEVRHYNADDESWTVYEQPPAWEPNDMYLEELRHFMDCVETRQPTTLPIEEAARVTAVALAAKESAQSGHKVQLS